jgi:hypothetical protein
MVQVQSANKSKACPPPHGNAASVGPAARLRGYAPYGKDRRAISSFSRRAPAGAKAKWSYIEPLFRFSLLSGRDFFRKPVSTFRDHAEAAVAQW